MFDDEAVVLVWHKDESGNAVDSFARIETTADDVGGEAITAVRWFYFCPELIREVGEALGVPVKTNGYRH